jgi:hypothetical protein
MRKQRPVWDAQVVELKRKEVLTKWKRFFWNRSVTRNQSKSLLADMFKIALLEMSTNDITEVLKESTEWIKEQTKSNSK